MNDWTIRNARIYITQEQYDDLVYAAKTQEYVTDDEYSHEVLFPDGKRVQVGLYSYWDDNDENVYETIFYVELLNGDGLIIDEANEEDVDRDTIDGTWVVTDRTNHVRYYTCFAIKENQVLIA